MDILLKRIAKRDSYTIGKLYINNNYFCDTIEDKDRALTQQMDSTEIQKIKVYAQTAIPTGKYQVVMTYSSRFKKVMPLLLNVPGFSGIRIHSGNTANETEGCIITGQNKVVGKVINSRVTTGKLYSIIKKACTKEKIYITIQ